MPSTHTLVWPPRPFLLDRGLISCYLPPPPRDPHGGQPPRGAGGSGPQSGGEEGAGFGFVFRSSYRRVRGF